jgi:hypothetical protein
MYQLIIYDHRWGAHNAIIHHGFRAGFFDQIDLTTLFCGDFSNTVGGFLAFFAATAQDFDSFHIDAPNMGIK